MAFMLTSVGDCGHGGTVAFLCGRRGLYDLSVGPADRKGEVRLVCRPRPYGVEYRLRYWAFEPFKGRGMRALRPPSRADVSFRMRSVSSTAFNRAVDLFYRGFADHVVRDFFV